MHVILNTLRDEPARVVGCILALLGLLTAFGLGVTDEQTAAVVAFVGAVLAFFGGETVRSQVMPMARVHQRVLRATLAGREDVLDEHEL